MNNLPNGWEIKKIEDIATIKVGRDLSEEKYSKNKDNTHFYPVYSNTVDNRGLYGFYNFPEYQEDSVTVVGRGIGLGKAFARYNTKGFGAIGRLLVLIPKKNSFDVRYFADYINHNLRIFNESGGIPQLTGKSLAKYFVTLPPLPEQQKIAEILKTWDKAINTVEKLLTNSEQQKKALMQQLLTAKKRLKDKNGVEFCGKWKNFKLGAIAKITTGNSNREDSTAENGQYTFFDRSEDIRTSHRYLFDGKAVIVAGEGQDFIPKHFEGKFDLHQRTYAIMEFKQSDSKFIYYYIHYYRHYFLAQAVGSTVKSLRLPMFQKMPIKLPSLEEQQAIAQVLTTADQQIDNLKQQLNKLKAEKKALMQQLLTGKIRV